MSEIVMTPELTKAIQDAVNPADMRALVQAELEKQTATAATINADQKAAEAARIAAAAVTTPEVFTRTEIIGGREFVFEASSEAELDREVLNAYKVAYAVQPQESVTATAAPVVDAAKEAELEAVKQVELEAQYKRGEISTADYLEQSGAVRDYLAKQGIPVESLKATVERNADELEAQSWASAVEDFKSGPGKDWPGGEKNLEIIGLVISSKPELLNASDKVAALTQAYATMKATGTIFGPDTPAESAVVTTATTTAAATATPVTTTPAAAPVAAAPAAPRTAPQSSTLFGISSGANEGVSTIAPKGDVKIDPNASPAEILEQWKRANMAAGKDPNAAFVETYSARRA